MKAAQLFEELGRLCAQGWGDLDVIVTRPHTSLPAQEITSVKRFGTYPEGQVAIQIEEEVRA